MSIFSDESGWRRALGTVVVNTWQKALDVRLPMLEDRFDLTAEVLRVKRVGRWFLFLWVQPLDKDCAFRHACEQVLGAPVEEIRVVAGQNLSRLLRHECTGELIKRIKPGCMVSVSGWPYRSVRPSTAEIKIDCLELLADAHEVTAQERSRHQRQRERTPALRQQPQDRSARRIPAPPEDCYALQLPHGSISVLQGLVGLEVFQWKLDNLLLVAAAAPGQTVVGIDVEWQPVAKGEPTLGVSIVQVATREEVFIIDALSMIDVHISSCVPCCKADLASNVDLISLLARLFEADGVVKLGFDAQNDLKMLFGSHPHLCALEIVRETGFLELTELAGQALLDPAKRWRQGLSCLVKRLVGQGLDKRQQCSSWDERPLSTEQILYAAQDAHCLIRVYDELRAVMAADTVCGST